MPFGQVLPPGEPLPDLKENEYVWSGCVEIRRHAKNGSVRYTANLTYEKGNNNVRERFRQHVDEFVKQLPDQLPE